MWPSDYNWDDIRQQLEPGGRMFKNGQLSEAIPVLHGFEASCAPNDSFGYYSTTGAYTDLNTTIKENLHFSS